MRPEDVGRTFVRAWEGEQMKRLRLAAVAQFAPLGALAPLGVAASAQAAERVPFTVTEQINFATGASTFTRPVRCARRARSLTT